MKNNRTFLEKLLDGAEVEWKPLKKVCNFISTGKLNANAMDENGIYPFFTCNEKPYKINNYAFDMEAILISGNGSQVGHLNYFKGKFNAYQRTYVIGEFDNNTLVMYLYHYLNFKLRDYITINSKKGSVPYITLPMLEKFEIPIPPLSVQTEIVKILDALTALTSELTSELILRQKQYEYYREKLLSEEELGKVGFEWKCLKNIFNIFAGGDVPKEFYSQHKTQEFNIPILSNGTGNKSLYGWTNKAKINKPSLTISARGTIGWTSYREEPFYPIVRLLVLTPKIELNLKYAYHFMKMIEKNYKVPESGIPQLTKPMIEDLRIPVPSFSEQQSIASILDKFETLTHSITEGLPLAIQQSQKRYEYYRELLLNFPGRE
ncbi:restriction endonuclease subunit S [Haemophilus influenzae]|uniref:restriction endonuclease subunit S n=1 Tax=Haemophilus influenzae TaxID=727 RepID=UPI000E34CE4D|nr:restriction endonuclease subunit S [Haemophilus influenzae]MCK8932661.1 restriction endonuclease subunit S [Haemophilus influenzae]RFO66246.1 restriction endonuclease subunit S [Haemophilus influenzae]RFO70636.1 restriction endonuclease subunit S [Haemophilus influenzae]